MLLATIDPGAKAGAALWLDGILDYCTLVQSKDLWDWRQRQATADRTVLELPIHYKEGRSKGDPNDLIKLAYRAGRLAPFGEPELIYPVTWKGNVPDEALYPRILGALSPTELALIPRLPKSLIHNVWDAIGIGLHVLGRMPRFG